MELTEKAKTHEVEHILTGISGSRHFFDVVSGESGEKYGVKLELSCTCRYMSVQGIPNGRICSHIMSVINKISKEGGIKQ
mgnify:CR=1 FL=1